MTNTRMHRSRWRIGGWLLAMLLVMVACNTLVPRQGWDPSLGPVVRHDTFPADCTLCHAGTDWHTLKQSFQFDHAKETGVALHGAHTQVSCLLCHNDRGPAASFAAQGCAGCHGDPHRSQLGRRCVDCHDEQTWRPSAMIAMHDRTRFPLVGTHAAVACFRCHLGAQVGNFAGASTECVHCHAAKLVQAVNPDHRTNGWTSNCQSCHRPLAWSPAQFQHPAAFPLTCGHANRACAMCHTSGSFTALPTDCASCHLRDYQNTRVLPHAAAGIGTDCVTCHNTCSWTNARYPHATTFPLTGGHAISCSRCHTTPGVFTGLSTVCSTCHLGQFNASVNPPHARMGLGTDCQTCHRTTAWRPSTFVHRLFTLTGNHNVACVQCHMDPTNVHNFTCTVCHTAAQTNPHHTGVRNYQWLSSACYQCHPHH